MNVDDKTSKLNLETYISATRLPFSSASVLPVIMVAVYIYRNDYNAFNIINTVLSIFGVLFLHLAANTLNDFFDWDESDEINSNASPFNGGSRYVLGEKNFDQIRFLYVSVLLLTAALISGVLLIFNNRPLVLVFGLIGALFGILYSMEPFSFQKKGFGELLIFLAFGPVLTMGAGYGISGELYLIYALLGITFGLVTTAIIFINEIPDYEADLQTNKRNLIVKFGKSSGKTFVGFTFLMFFISIITLVYAKVLPAKILYIAIFLPLTVHILFTLKKHLNNTRKLINAQKNTIIFQILSSIMIILIIGFR